MDAILNEEIDPLEPKKKASPVERGVIKPCPFCGSDCVNDTTDPKPDEFDKYYWVCPDCVACGPIGDSVSEATEAWDKRAI